MHDFCFAYVFHVVEVHTDIWYAKHVHYVIHSNALTREVPAFQPNYTVQYKLKLT